MNRLFPDDPQPVYCCDADALIYIYRANLWRQLRKLAQQGRLKIARRVRAELRRGTDRLGKRLDTLIKYDAVVDLDHLALTYLPDIERSYGPEFHIGGITYPGFWKSASGRHSADAQVIALAKARGWIVVSNDQSVRGACLLEDIRCLPWDMLAQAIRHL